MDVQHIKKPELELLISAIIKKNVDNSTWEWLKDRGIVVSKEIGSNQLIGTFSAVQRKTVKKNSKLTEVEEIQIDKLLPGFSIHDWSIQRLCRVWLLMQINSSDKYNYLKNIEALFGNAEMNELVALYSALPVLDYPEEWRIRCAEGIRSYMGSVLEAIMYDNPYPSGYLSEPAWNQLILKALFTDKEINRIVGLDDRANKSLATALFDYIHERQAANRTVNIQLWRLVGKFLDENNFDNIYRLFQNGDIIEKKAAALACSLSEYEPAKILLQQESNLKTAIEEDKLNWNSLVEEQKKYRNL